MKGMKIFKKPAALLLAAVMVVSTALGSAALSKPATAEAAPGTALTDSDFITASGKNLYNAEGELIQLKGTNVGGWLFQEFWMTITNATANVTAEVDVYKVLEERFGEEKMWELLNAYQDSYLTEADLDKMVELGVNCIRAPFWWRNLVDADGTPYEDCFARLDWLVEQAGARGMYVIIDFHGAPGSQNGSDHSGVDGGDDKEGASHFFWGEDAADNQALYYDMWEMIAEHYKGNPIVAGYDLLNEPFCTYRYNTDYEETELLTMLWDIYDVAYDRIRAIDPDHIVIMEATWDPADLPNPESYGWTNVMYEYHNYLYDDYDNANGQQITNMESKISSIGTADYNVPSYLGEFAYFNNIDAWDQGLELLANSGVSFTTWTYKTISDYGNWGLVHQDNAQINLETDSYETILAAYQNAGTTADNAPLQAVAEKWFKTPAVENTLGPTYAEIADGTYYLRGNHSNKVVTVGEDGLVQGGSSAFIADDVQLITITNVGDNKVIMQSGNGKYITVDAEGILHADADTAEDAEEFIAVQASSATVGFRSTTTYKFVCLDENFDDFRLVADRSGTGSWETYYLNDPTVIVTETYSGWTRYEAESADTLGGAVETQDFYSAKKGIGSMNTGTPEAEIAEDLSNIKYVAFKVDVPKAGTYRALVGYNGDDDKQIVVKVNDNAYEVVDVPAVRSDHAWNEMHELYLELDLAEGENTVIISGTINNSSTWMNLDYLDIADYPITLTENGELYESETFISNGTAEAQSFYSNGLGYGNMNSNCEYENLADDFSNAKYVDYTVYVNEAGTYDITLAYNGESYDNMPAAYKVNGGDKKALTLNNAVSGAWNVMNSITFAADLNAGINDVLISGTLSAYSNWANHDYILVTPHVAVETVRYEAEDAALYNGVAVTEDNAGNCSQGAAVGSTENQIGVADIAEDWSNVKYIEFTVEAPKKGTYGLEIAYYGDDDKTVAYQVNDGAVTELSVPNVQEDHAWDAIHTVVANVELEEGTNTIKISGILNGTGWINYDYIEIGEPFEIEEPEPEEPTHIRYESEEATLHNVNITDDNSGKCSGGKAVGSTENSIGIDDINEDWSNVKYVDYTVTVEADGIYEVILAYYGDDDKTVAYKVNDGDKTELALPRLADGSWDTIHKVPVKMQLKAGENHILVSGILNGTGWANYDYIDVSIAYEDVPVTPDTTDKTALSAAIAAADAVDTAKYTEESAAALTAALEAANAVFANESATQEEVDEAASALISAMEDLVLKEEPEEPSESEEEPSESPSESEEEPSESPSESEEEPSESPSESEEEPSESPSESEEEPSESPDETDAPEIPQADKAALSAAIGAASEIALEKYTAESAAVLNDALEAANAVLADDEATQEEVDQATTQLLRAIEGLTAAGGLEPGEGGETGDMNYAFYLLLMMAGLSGMAFTFRRKLLR